MPIDTTTQEGRALQKAVAVRSARASLKRGLKRREIDPYPLLAGGNPIWEDTVRGMKLGQLLEAIPGVGPVTAAEALAELRLTDRLTPAGMTFELRQELSELLRDAVEGPGVPVPESVE